MSKTMITDLRTIAAGAAGLIMFGSASALAQPAAFTHIVVVVQENRTPDNLFGSNPTFEKGVDIATSGIDLTDQTIPLTATPLAGCYDLGHAHSDWVAMYDGGKMDGADRVQVGAKAGCKTLVLPDPQFRFVDNSTGQVQPYFDIATSFGFANRMFQTNQGPSFPAHQFIFAGTSAPTKYSPLFASENMSTGYGYYSGAGCVAPPTQRVDVIDPSGNETTHPPIYPCFEHPTLTDQLDFAGLSWKYYTPAVGSIWTAPTAIRHICVPGRDNGQRVCTGTDWTSNVVLNPAQILTDVKGCQLPSVSWVIPSTQQSDHAGVNNGSGPQWVASIVNAIGTAAACSGETYWNDTAILITWDDWGGWYDHVPPFRIGQENGWGTGYTYGFRVPLLVVSAYTPAGYVDQSNIDFGSLLRFIEINFNLHRIDPGIYADAYWHHPLREFFSLTAPRAFEAIPTALGVDYFTHLSQPLIGPDDDGDDD